MLFVRRELGDEKSQLNELNRRLDQYLAKVRQLEGENQHLVEEIHRLRLERGTEWTQVYHPEIFELRRKVEELTVQKCEAELQRDNLLQQLQDLQDLLEQVRNIRLKIDQQLALYKQDLQQAQKRQVALDKLYIQLQEEYQMLHGSHEEELQALRNEALQMPLQITMQEVLKPRLSLTEIESFSLELSDSWKEAFVYYQKKIEDLESILKLSDEDRHGAEAEANVYRLQMEKVHKEYEELLGIKNTLEDELRRMKHKYNLEVEEYEILIEELENEKKNISMTITERLKEYHDLMNVKTGLSLEVAAYRALLEAESQKSTVIVTEHTVRDRPAGYVTSTFEETTRFSDRGQDKIQYPRTQVNDEMRWKTQTTNADRFLTRTIPQTQIKSRYTNLGNTNSSYVERVYEHAAQEKGSRWNSMPYSPSYKPPHKPEATSGLRYQTAQPATVTPYASSQSTVISQTTKQEQIKDLKPVARPRTHSKEARKSLFDINVENKQQELDSRTKTKAAEDRKINLQSAEEEMHVIGSTLNYTTRDNQKASKEKVSVTETVQKEAVQEPKAQELPVKKERKKREQAKKRKEELENMPMGDMNVTRISKVEVYEATDANKATVLGEKTQDEPIVLEIPIRFAGRKQEIQQKDNTVEDTARNVSQRYVSKEPMQEYRNEKMLVDDLLKQLGQPSAFDTNEANISPEESSQGSTFMKTFVLGKKSEDKQVVMDIPIHLEVNKKEISSSKENMEKQSRVPVNQMNINKNEEGISRYEEVDRSHKDVENKKISRTDESVSVSTEGIRKKTLVADILKQLGQPSDLDDTNVTYEERKEKCIDGTMRTEIIVQSKSEEEMDLFDEPDLTDLWNTTSSSSPRKHISVEEIQSKKIKKTVLEDITGAEAEEWIGNVIHTGLKGSPGKSVNVEIVEESIGTFEYEKGEISTPFHVEEAEDSYIKEFVKPEELHPSTKTDEIQDNIQPSEAPAHVEEITEGEHIDEETNYFVSIPDDNPYFEEEEEETIRGQIYTEEESHVKYSWQDEFLQGSQGRKSLSDMLKQASANEQSSVTYKTSVDSADTLDKEEQKEKSHVETIAIEKRATYDSSMERSDKLEDEDEYRHSHFKTVYDKVADDSYLMGRSDSLEKKVQKGESDVGIFVTEKVTVYGAPLDSYDKFDSEEQKGESHVETVVVEKKIKVPHEIQSSIMDFLSKDIKDPQQQLKGTLECLKESLPQELAEELSAIAGEEQTQTSSLAVDIKKVGQTEDSGKVTVVAEISLSQTLDIDDIGDLELNETEEEAMNKFQMKSSDNVISVLQKEEDIGAFISESDGNQESHHSIIMELKHKDGSYMSKENIETFPTTTSPDFNPREMSFGHISTDANHFIKHIELDTSEQNVPEVSPDGLSPTEVNRSEHHIRLGPRETFSSKQIIFEGPISEAFQLDIVKNTDDKSEQNRSIKHITISPSENVPTEQIIFQGPIFKTKDMRCGITEEFTVQEKQIESGSLSPQILNFKGFQSGNQETSSQSSELFIGGGRAVSDFNVNSGETFSKQIIFEGGIPKAFDFNRSITVETDNSENDNRPTEHSSPTPKIHVEKQIKYQGFVSEQHAVEDYGDNTEQNDQTNVNTSVHHIKLSPSKEHIVFQCPISANVHISGEDNTYVEDTNRSIRHIRLGSPEMHMSKHTNIEGPTTETYDSSDFFLSSPSGDSTESERSIKHIKLGPTDKTFTFQMDITKVATKYSPESGDQESGIVVTSSKYEGQPDFSQSSTKLMDDIEVAESGYGEEEIAGISQSAYEILPHSQTNSETSELEKTVQMQRIVHQGHIVSNERKVAVVYLDEEEEEPDQDYLRRSF